MTCLFDRFLTEDLEIPAADPVMEFFPHPRIQVKIFDDAPCFQGLFIVDNTVILKENMIQDLSEFYQRTCADRNFHAFLIEYIGV